jgi:ADP-ribose pyrophosphatase
MRFDYTNPHLEFKGKRFQVYTVDEDQSGKVVKREVVSHPGAVVILPFLDAKTILLIENKRYSVQRKLIELPAGTLEPGEPPLETAYRELAEETGYRANVMTHLLQFFPSPGFCNEIIYSFVAKDLDHVGQSLDETENITVLPTLFTDALRMVREGVICDAKTICTLLYHSQFR